jgi:BarA-like signal transduction histidine kinase
MSFENNKNGGSLLKWSFTVKTLIAMSCHDHGDHNQLTQKFPGCLKKPTPRQKILFQSFILKIHPNPTQLQLETVQ